jgi:heme-degrading monooxygenase HmoA
VAVIFTSVLKEESKEAYRQAAREMEFLAARQPGFLGVESARDQLGITVSYWSSEKDALNWKHNAEHLHTQALGRQDFYLRYHVRIAQVSREYRFNSTL